MKKYRCPNCKEVFIGAQEICPKCGVTLRYANKEKERPVEEEEAVSVANFSFNDPEVIKHEEKFVPVTSIESLDNPQAGNGDAQAAPLVPGQMRTVAQGESFFDGKAMARVGIYLSAFLIVLFTLGFGTVWAYCRVVRWDTNHSVVSGHRLKFTGKGGKLFGRYLLWLLLIPLTLGIILIKVQIFLQKWKINHIEFLD